MEMAKGGTKGDVKALLQKLNEALEMEYSSVIFYKHHAEFLRGPHAESVYARFQEIAEDEMEHANKLLKRIVALGGVPSTELSPDIKIRHTEDLGVMLKDGLEEEETVLEFYLEILEEAKRLEPRDSLLIYNLYKIIDDTQEHVEELKRLMG
jgi:bacterioferritin